MSAIASNISSRLKPDRFTSGPACVTIGTTFCALLLCGMPGLISTISIPITVFGGPIILLGLCLQAAMLGFRRRWRASVSILIAAALPALLLQPILWTSDYTHLGLTVGLGLGQFGSPMVTEDGLFRAHDWSVGFAGGPVTFLIYDATDKIAESPAYSSHGIDCAWAPRHLIGHYYICSF